MVSQYHCCKIKMFIFFFKFPKVNMNKSNLKSSSESGSAISKSKVRRNSNQLHKKLTQKWNRDLYSSNSKKFASQNWMESCQLSTCAFGAMAKENQSFSRWRGRRRICSIYIFFTIIIYFLLLNKWKLYCMFFYISWQSNLENSGKFFFFIAIHL